MPSYGETQSANTHEPPDWNRRAFRGQWGFGIEKRLTSEWIHWNRLNHKRCLCGYQLAENNRRGIRWLWRQLLWRFGTIKLTWLTWVVIAAETLTGWVCLLIAIALQQSIQSFQKVSDLPNLRMSLIGRVNKTQTFQPDLIYKPREKLF